MIYLDHAATSWPKPPQILQAMSDYLGNKGGNPGRSGHRLSIAAGRVVFQTREAVAELFAAQDPLKVIFTLNATHALNIALQGLLRPGDRVVTTGMEHNAVMRPLRSMERYRGIQVVVVPCGADGTLDPEDLAQEVTPSTRLVAINHASNVAGTLAPAAQAAEIAHAVGVFLLLDVAQTAGVFPIDMASMDVDFLAFTGHKGMQGPPGTGGLVLGERVDPEELASLTQGGTGSRSEIEQQPEFLPDKYESGTSNGVGIAGLGAGIAWIRERGIETIRQHEIALTKRLLEGLGDVPGVTVYGPDEAEKRTAVVSFTVKDRYVSEIGQRLDENFGVLCRVGLHCAPAAHHTLGTFPGGTVRLAPGPMTTMAEIDQAIEAVAKAASE